MSASVASVATNSAIAQDRSRRPRGLLPLAVGVWILQVLSVTLARSLPLLSAQWLVVCEALGVAGAFAVVLVGDAGWQHWNDVAILVMFLLIPVVAIVLALNRHLPSDSINYFDSALVLLAASRLSARLRLLSAWLALLSLIVSSLLLGLLDPAVVGHNQRGYLRPIYDGRLYGLLQSDNVLAQFSVIMITMSLFLFEGRRRLACVAIGIFAILAASSQTALIATVLAIMVTYCLGVWRRHGSLVGIYLTCLVLCALGLATLVTALSAPVGLQVRQHLGSYTFDSRSNIWELLFQQQIPFTGLGQTQLAFIFTNSVIPGATDVTSAQNAWLDAYFRDGIPGLLALGVLTIALVAFMIKRRAATVLVPLLVFLVEGFSEVTPTHVPFLALYFTLVTAVTPGPIRGPRADNVHAAALRDASRMRAPRDAADSLTV